MKSLNELSVTIFIKSSLELTKLYFSQNISLLDDTAIKQSPTKDPGPSVPGPAFPVTAIE